MIWAEYIFKGGIMGFLFFGKKKNESEPAHLEPTYVPAPPKECSHHWQDFPPYLNYKISDTKYEIEVIEPYVCLDCKRRKEVTLLHLSREGANVYNEGEAKIAQLQKQYEGFIEDRLVVEDKINDVINVDSEYNKFWLMIHGMKNPSNSHNTTEDKPKLRL